MVRMARMLIGIIVMYTAIALYSLFDCIAYDSSRVKMMPKIAWAAVILFLPVVGIVLWFLFGRGSAAQKQADRPAPNAPDNDPEYLQKISDDLELRRLRELQRQQEEQRRAEELRGGPEPRTYSSGKEGKDAAAGDAASADAGSHDAEDEAAGSDDAAGAGNDIDETGRPEA